MIFPVIMAGGSGTRLWPMSRTHYPKQFLSLFNDFSMLQETIKRLQGIEHYPVSLICNEEHRFLVAEQLRASKIHHSGIILEPFGRNTAPAVALAAMHSMQLHHNDPVLLILAADHMVKRPDIFRDTVNDAFSLAMNGKLVTFGVTPTKPETGYGYIRRGRAVESSCAYLVDAFVEKPNVSIAEEYVSEGGYYWNSGMFMFKASKYLEELEKFRPDIYSAVKAAYSGMHTDLDFIRLNEQAFSLCPDESIDYAVMEKTSDAVVVPMDADWCDVGAWSALWEVCDKDTKGNAIFGDVLTESTHRCYINAPERLVAAVGIEDLVIVDTKDALLVAHRDKVQEVKTIVSQLKECERSEYLHHREVYRPWGKYDLIIGGERYDVKKVVVKPGHRTAMQCHYHRSEHWVIVSGTAKVHRGKEVHIVSENESIYIPVGIEHCLENPGKIPLYIIEVRTGSYLSEDDIHRISS
ncbi:mannose-1-phosphate guanylyltransferase/mannose-6-phosphate isomerase [Aeromonas veronii]|uniref:mannose-1-phosphate guanylyltransferase/mannose-6-phosphate isomerase n=1 Tax=Aeromonas veronii TaxID=654 RepID=UPI003F7B3A13